MIVPRLRLILVAALFGLPGLGWSLAQPEIGLGIAPLLLGLVGLCAWDAWRGRQLVQTLTAEMPESLRLFQDRAGVVEVAFVSTLSREISLRVGLLWPPEIVSTQEELSLTLPRAGRHSVSWPCRPKKRGHYQLRGCAYEIVSQFGLWDIRRRQTKRTDIRVYPNLEAERKNVATLFLQSRLSGLRSVRQLGQGRDFEKLREYVPGDGFEMIHWKATARRGQPITKVYQIERTQEVYVLIDASRLSQRRQNAEDPLSGTHLDRYITAGLILGQAAEKNGDLFGLITFSDHVLNFVRARNGKDHFNACREALYALEPQRVSADFEELATFVRLRLRRRALLIFFTELDDPLLMESFQRCIKILCPQHIVHVQVLSGKNLEPIFSQPKAAAGVTEIYEQLAHHYSWEDFQKLAAQLRQQSVHLAQCSADRFSTEVISNYYRIKQRQLL